MSNLFVAKAQSAQEVVVVVVENNDGHILNKNLNTAKLWKALEQRSDIIKSLFQNSGSNMKNEL